MDGSAGVGLSKLAWSEKTEAIIGAAIEVHRHLGPGLLDSIYETCLCREFAARDIPYQRQLEIPVFYKGEHVDGTYRIDLIAFDEIIIESRAVERVIDVHEAQLLTYLRLLNKRVGLLINFNVPILTKGIIRRVL